MKNKSKKSIVIGITSLFLIMLILVGLTYAYYRTRIIGNTSSESSISVQSKNMEIVYEDGSAVLSTEGKVEPGFTATKIFYVENIGDQSVNYSIMLENMTNEFQRNQDWTYTLTENGTEIASGYLAVGTHQVLSGSRSIVETTGTKNTYVLTIIYLNSEEDQSEDMGMNLSFKVNIKEEQYTWNDAPEGSLLYALKNNQPTGTEITIPGQEVSTTNEARILTTEDDYGTSYVYRGNVENNYVNYSGMCWRVLRVQGDGTIKLVLADENEECDAVTDGYKAPNINSTISSEWVVVPENYVYGDSAKFENSNILTELTTWAADNNLDISKIVATDWCNDMSIAEDLSYGYDENFELTYDKNLIASPWFIVYNYGGYKRLANSETANPSLKCNFKGLEIDGVETKALRSETNLGILTADEIAFVGCNSIGCNKNYLTGINSGAWTLTPSQFETDETGIGDTLSLFSVGKLVSSNYIGGVNPINPVIVLKNNVLIETSGNGTQSNPYIIL